MKKVDWQNIFVVAWAICLVTIVIVYFTVDKVSTNTVPTSEVTTISSTMLEAGDPSYVTLSTAVSKTTLTTKSTNITFSNETFKYVEVDVPMSKFPHSWIKEFRLTESNTSCQMQCDQMFRDSARCTGFLTVDEYMCQFFFLDATIFTTSAKSKKEIVVKIMAREELKQGNTVILIGGWRIGGLCIGGGSLKSKETSFQEVQVLDIENLCYRKMTDLPIEAVSPIVGVIRNQIHMCSSSVMKTSCWAYNYVSKEWELQQSISNSNHCRKPSIAWQNRFYVVENYNAEFYDATMKIWFGWQSVPDLFNTMGYCAVMWENKIIVAGYTFIAIYNILTKRWRQLPNFSSNFNTPSHQCIVLPNSDAFIMTGFSGSLMLNLTTHMWWEIPSPQYPRGQGIFAQYVDRIFLVGGSNDRIVMYIDELIYSNSYSIQWNRLPEWYYSETKLHFRGVTVPRFLFTCNNK